MADQEKKEIITYFCIRLLLCVFHGIRFKLTGYTPRLREVGRLFFRSVRIDVLLFPI